MGWGAGRVLGETAATPGDTFTLHWHPVWVYFAGPAIMGMMMIMARFNRCASHLHIFISLPTPSSALCNCSDSSQCSLNTTVYTLHFIWCDPSHVDAADFKMHLKRWQFEFQQCSGQFQFHCCFCLPPRCGGVGASPIRPAFPCGDFLGRQKSIAFIHF